MPTFVHVSDIHFGQEKRPGEVIVNDDIKLRLIEDASGHLRKIKKHPAAGILVTGDIAYAGKIDQYEAAGKWLDDLAAAIGCKKSLVHLVPGNHDIDRAEISPGLETVLTEIAMQGPPKLDSYLGDDAFRKILYRRFANYAPFAMAYDCPLSLEGGLAGDKPVSLAKERTLRFIGLNTALACSKNDSKGCLLVGEKQMVLPKTPGEELVVLAHHPMEWLRDGPNALDFIRARARVLITGHEHNPAVTCESLREGCDLLTLAAGATVPPSNEARYFTYNIIDFHLNADTDQLCVTVYPKSWNDKLKDFEDDPSPLNGAGPTYRLGCPNFRSITQRRESRVDAQIEKSNSDQVQEWNVESGGTMAQPLEDFSLLLLRFFRDLAPGQRLRVLVSLGALPNDWEEDLSHAVERHIVDRLNDAGRLRDLSAAIEDVVAADNKKDSPGYD